MSANFIAKASTSIDAPASIVWEALTNPARVKQYLFGTQVQSDWKIGSVIRWQGTYEGKPYTDKGTVLQVLPGKLLQYTYHSSMSGIEDRPENYFNITYELEETDGHTTVLLTNANLPDEHSRYHAQNNWQMVLAKLKAVWENEKDVVKD